MQREDDFNDDTFLRSSAYQVLKRNTSAQVLLSLKSMPNFRPYLNKKSEATETDFSLKDSEGAIRPKGGQIPLILTSSDRHLQAKQSSHIKDTGQFLRARVVFSAQCHR